MEPISHIKAEGKIGSCIFNYSDIELMNLYRRSILEEIETYCIEYVCFDINTTSTHDDKLALKLGQLVIDNEEFTKEEVDISKRYYIDISGPKKFTSDDIIGLPITFRTPILELQSDERIKCFVMVTKNTSRTHVKWRPVGLVATNEIVNGYFISRLNVGKELKVEKYETHYIDSIIIKKNTTYIDDHAIVTLIGELQIDYDNFKSDLEEIKININKKGPGYLITSNDKFVIPFKFNLDIDKLSSTNKIYQSTEILIDELRINYDNFKSDLEEIKISINEKDSGYLITVNDKFLVPFKVSYTNKIDSFIQTLIDELRISYGNFKSYLEEIKITINENGLGYLITANDKLEVPFKYHLDIGELSYTNEIHRDYNPQYPTLQKYESQEINCDIIIKKGKRNNLIRWKDHLYDYDDKVTGYQIVINNIGMLSTEKIFEEGLKKIRTAASREQTPITIFHKVRLPANIPDSIPL